MWFFWIGIGMVALRLLDAPFFGQLHWGWVFAPFGLAVAWWALADHLGITQRRLMAEHAQRADERRDRQYEAMGMRAPRDRNGQRKPYKGYPKHRT
jgi:small Trp-rich protein